MRIEGRRTHFVGNTAAGNESYVVLMIVGKPGSLRGELYGPEHDKEMYLCRNRYACRLVVDARFESLFPGHVCGMGCTAWRYRPRVQPDGPLG